MTNAEQQRQNQHKHLQKICQEQGGDMQLLDKLIHAERIKKLYKPKSGIKELIKELF